MHIYHRLVVLEDGAKSTGDLKNNCGIFQHTQVLPEISNSAFREFKKIHIYSKYFFLLYLLRTLSYQHLYSIKNKVTILPLLYLVRPLDLLNQQNTPDKNCPNVSKHWLKLNISYPNSVEVAMHRVQQYLVQTYMVVGYFCFFRK